MKAKENNDVVTKATENKKAISKIEEYRKMTSSDLEKELGELKSELFKLRFQLSLGGLDNPMKIRNAKRDIARIKTILTEKSSEAE